MDADDHPKPASPAGEPVKKQTAGVEMGKEIRTLVAGLMQEGERAAVVVGAARLELALERLLTRVMQPHPGGSDNLFDPERPLGTFSAKISLAFRLGLLDPKVESALQLIRRIRNEFAHSVGAASLSENSHANRLRELTDRCRADSHYEIAIENMRKVPGTEKLQLFCAALILLIAAIESAGFRAKPYSIERPAAFT